MHLRNQISSGTLFLHSPAEWVMKFALDLDISLVHYRALRLSKWEPLLFITDAPTRQNLNVTEAECSFNLKEWKNLTVGGGLSCHSFLKRLLFFSQCLFSRARGFGGVYRGCSVCVSRCISRAHSRIRFGGGGGARRAASHWEWDTEVRRTVIKSGKNSCFMIYQKKCE